MWWEVGGRKARTTGISDSFGPLSLQLNVLSKSLRLKMYGNCCSSGRHIFNSPKGPCKSTAGIFLLPTPPAISNRYRN